MSEVIPLSVRFWTKVDKRTKSECWPWLGYVQKNGYGRICHTRVTKTRHALAHRLAWALSVGPVPAGLVVLHLCDNKLCMNSDHMALGTQAANMFDMAHKGRRVSSNAGKPTCIRGHVFDESNTRVRADGRRGCRACQHEYYTNRRDALLQTRAEIEAII